MTGRETDRALHAWRERLGEASVLGGEAARQRYGPSTSGAERMIAAALRPRSAEDVVAIVKVAADCAVPLYPISTGKNWGYSDAAPARDGCVIVDLGGLDGLEIDREAGLVTLEPGVTQQMLGNYLDVHDLPFLVPVTGAGPHCSLLGNALERGYGITPYTDHFGAVTALEAVLADGRLYRSALSELGGVVVDRAYKWGVGPYLDGLFAQSGFGIVTKMTIALAPRPERSTAFLFTIGDDRGLEPAVAAVHQTLRRLGGIIGSINLMNAERVLAMTAPYPTELVGPDGVLPASVVAELARRHRVSAWTGFGALYGAARVVQAARREIRKALKPAGGRVRFVAPGAAAAVARRLQRIPVLRGSGIARKAQAVASAMQLVAGRPSEVALRLAYWRSASPPRTRAPLDPAADGCGLIWYSPLVPMMPERVRRYVAIVRDICARHRIEPLITLTSLSDRCFDSSVPLLFERADRAATERARACYMALLDAGKSEGFLPYRVGIQGMDWLVRPGQPYWEMAAALKAAIDPRGIISPGRYSL